MGYWLGDTMGVECRGNTCTPDTLTAIISIETDRRSYHRLQFLAISAVTQFPP